MTTNGSDGAQEAATPDDATGPFDIYETANGPRHVGNTVRRLLLRKMQGAELTVPQMIDATGLTKSTISAHLAVLHKDQMVAYREDPEDRRRKRYYLTARHVGTTRPCTERLAFHDSGVDATPGELGVDRLVLRSLIAELTCCGLDLAPVVHETGRRVGELIGSRAPSASIQAWAASAAEVWEAIGWGRLEVSSEDPPILEVTDCGLCFDGADRRMSLSEITAGVLEGMAAEALQVSVEVHPVPLEGAAPPTDARCRCRFEMHITSPPTAATGAPGAAAEENG